MHVEKELVLARRAILVLAVAAALLVASVRTSTNGRKFYDDDPLGREPETQDASGATPWTIDLFWDLSYSLFGHPGDHPVPKVRARDVNTIDEVPDSGWYTNRLLATTLSPDAIRRGPLEGSGPAAGPWTVIRPKDSGFSPGFTARDAQGTTWFVSFDSKGYPEAATGAILVANKLFWALGYWQVENFLTSMRAADIAIAATATVTTQTGKRRAMRKGDLEAVLARAERSPDGSYRAIAARLLPGKVIGAFRYFGTRPDDPNDIVLHEHRRSLRALKVFGAWTNLVDMKAGNTLDTVVQENGRGIVRHYLQDVGSTFGTGANGPREWDEGWEYLYEGSTLVKRLVSFGFYLQPWQTARYTEYPAIGRFEGDAFEPEKWKPRVPPAAFLRARADDDFWAARRVMAFSDDMIRAAVSSGAFSDAKAAAHLSDVLIKRRDKIGRAYLVAVNPLVDFALDARGVLSCRNASVDAGVAEPDAVYRASWFRFDNATGAVAAIGSPSESRELRLQAPPDLPSAPGAYVKIQVSAVAPSHPSWAHAVDVYFRRMDGGWKLVGLDRLP